MSYQDNLDLYYSNMVKSLAKNGQDIVIDMTPKKAHLLHMAVGISGEAGELLDAVKKHVIYGKDLDLENVIEELGDLEFYMQGLRDELSLVREQCIRANVDKLSERYSSGSYSDQQAQDRADKKGEEDGAE